jgi:hypothetical protein
VHFVAIATLTPIVATLCTHTVRFVAPARGGRTGATKCTRADQHFVALAPPAATSATFVPYSQHFVAPAFGRRTIATKCSLASTQPQLTFA